MTLQTIGHNLQEFRSLDANITVSLAQFMLHSDFINKKRVSTSNCVFVVGPESNVVCLPEWMFEMVTKVK